MLKRGWIVVMKAPGAAREIRDPRVYLVCPYSV